MAAHYNRIFNIGLNRAGTTSLTEALALLGIRAVHHRHEGVRLYDIMRTNMHARRPLLHGLDMYDAFSDFAGHKFYRLLDRQYPYSRFILTTRELESWLDSRERKVARNLSDPDYKDAFTTVDRPGWTGSGPNSWPTSIATSPGGRAICWSSTFRRERAGRSFVRFSGSRFPICRFPSGTGWRRRRNRPSPEDELPVQVLAHREVVLADLLEAEAAIEPLGAEILRPHAHVQRRVIPCGQPLEARTRRRVPSPAPCTDERR